MAIKSPKAHKKVALVQFPSNEALLLEKGKGNVSPKEHPLGVDRAIFLFLSKKVSKRTAIPLVTQGNLAHVVDERWKIALQLQIPLLVLALSLAEPLLGISKICTKITEMELITTNLSGNQPDTQISNGKKGMKAKLLAGTPDGCNLVYMMIENLPPLPNLSDITPMGSFLPENQALHLMQYH